VSNTPCKSRRVAAVAGRPSRGRAAGLSGFSLIELLAVVGIISVLLMLLVPSLDRATELARMAACMSRQHNIANAQTSYAGAHGQRIPRSATYIPRPDGVDCLVDVHPWETTRGILWYETLHWGRYVGGLDIFICPTDDNPPKDPTRAYVSYGFNVYLERGGTDNRLDRVRRPAQTLLTAPNNASKASHTAVWNYTHPDAHRHQDYSAVYTFCDAHADVKLFKEMFEIEYHPDWTYEEHWQVARPEFSVGYDWEWGTNSSGEQFPYWAPWL
jgi:prepilin-type N-terminal cleavage/methylation domain-containing protein